MNNEEVMGVALCKSVIADDISLVQAILHHIKITNVSDNLCKKRKCNWNDSPLFIACQYGNPEIVSLLCGSGFLINVVDESNRTPLLAAVAIHQRLLSQPDVHGTLDAIPGIQRFWANRGKTVHMKEIVSLLIEKGADINITDSEYRTPLHQVCVDRNFEIVRHLLDNGANINAKDSDGMTPLFYCLVRKYFYHRPSSNAEKFQIFLNNHEEGNKILKYLVESGADINCKDTKDQSVLDHAYKTCKPFATFLLLKYGGMIRRNCKETLCVGDWRTLIIANLANAHFWRHLVRHTHVCRRIYFDIFDTFYKHIGRNKIFQRFFSITPDTEIPLSLKDQCRICIRNTISTYTEPGLQFEKCVKTLCMPKTLKSFLMFEELEQFVSVRGDLRE